MTRERTTQDLRKLARTNRLARAVLFAFVLTFLVARLTVFLVPELRVKLGGTHVHHLNFGIFLLTLIGGYLLFVRPVGRKLTLAAVVYGVGLGLTFDEFGMWLRLEDVYWQRASYDAVVIIAGILGLLVAGPTLRRIRRRQWATMAGLAAAATIGFLILNPL